MRAFQYARPSSLEQAIELLEAGGGKAVALAGGTDLLSLMKDDVERPERLVSLKAIAALGGVGRAEGGGLRIGAMCTIDQLLASPEAAAYPALLQAADGIKSPQLRTMGTVGGELLQRPRCWYYRAGFGLLAQYQGRSLVRDGDNRYHAILDNDGPALFVHPSSLAPALQALGARVQVAGPGGSGERPLRELYRRPRGDDEREVALAPGEILTEILLPPPPTRSATYEVRQHAALDWPLATASVGLVLDGRAVRTARVVLGHVAPAPHESAGAAAALAGRALDDDALAAAAAAAVAAAHPLSGNAYKVDLARVAVRRALERAGGREV